MTDETTFQPLLTNTDWAEEWKQLQVTRRAADDPAHWNERAKTFGCGGPSPYVGKFLEYARIQPDETVLDMGCGTGAIALPLGEAGNRVVAADFSEGMLSVLRDAMEQRKLTTIETKLMSWEDDWDAHGVGPKSVDVAVASRSIATSDLRAALARLNRVARRRVCLTLSCGPSPRTDERILRAIGLEHYIGRDFLYAFMILTQMGLLPQVNYISSERDDFYESFDDAFGNLKKMVIDAVGPLAPATETERALGNLREWLGSNLVEADPAEAKNGKHPEVADAERVFRLKTPRKITWGFISFDAADEVPR